MVAPLKRDELHHSTSVPTQPKYQDFKAFDTQTAKFQDLIFFVRLTSFAVIAVLSCFLLLATGMSAFLALPFGAMLGALITVTLAFLLDLLRR